MPPPTTSTTVRETVVMREFDWDVQKAAENLRKHGVSPPRKPFVTASPSIGSTMAKWMLKSGSSCLALPTYRFFGSFTPNEENEFA